MLSEQKLLSWLKVRFNQKNSNDLIGIGDDCAVIPFTKNKSLLYTVDCLVDGIHFKSKYITPFQIGQKAINVNVSDIAAMGGIPKHCLISLFLPKNIKQNFITELYNGLQTSAHELGITIVGGNISKSHKFSIDVFMIGETNPKKVFKRNGAKPGDLILVTGTIGDSQAGFKLLNNKSIRVIKLTKDYLIDRHLNPTARINESKILTKIGDINSMIDLSDGLSTDLFRLCEASSVGGEIYNEKIPISSQLKEFCLQTKLDPIELALNGGEDYELCFTTPKSKAQEIIRKITKKLGTKVTIVGKIVKLENKIKPMGFDHFK